jgi:hypothetical protein
MTSFRLNQECIKLALMSSLFILSSYQVLSTDHDIFKLKIHPANLRSPRGASSGSFPLVVPVLCGGLLGLS